MDKIKEEVYFIRLAVFFLAGVAGGVLIALILLGPTGYFIGKACGYWG